MIDHIRSQIWKTPIDFGIGFWSRLSGSPHLPRKESFSDCISTAVPIDLDLRVYTIAHLDTFRILLAIHPSESSSNIENWHSCYQRSPLWISFYLHSAIQADFQHYRILFPRTDLFSVILNFGKVREISALQSITIATVFLVSAV